MTSTIRHTLTFIALMVSEKIAVLSLLIHHTQLEHYHYSLTFLNASQQKNFQFNLSAVTITVKFDQTQQTDMNCKVQWRILPCKGQRSN